MSQAPRKTIFVPGRMPKGAVFRRQISQSEHGCSGRENRVWEYSTRTEIEEGTRTEREMISWQIGKRSVIPMSCEGLFLLGCSPFVFLPSEWVVPPHMDSAQKNDCKTQKGYGVVLMDHPIIHLFENVCRFEIYQAPILQRFSSVRRRPKT